MPHAPRPSRKSSPPARQPHRGGTLLGLFVGLALGLLIALGVAWYLRQAPLPFENKYQPPAKPATPPPGAEPKPLPLPGKAEAEDKPRFDFYGILEGKQPAAPPPEAKPTAAPPLPAPEAAVSGAAAAEAAKELLYLQAGAFQKLADADNLRAKLTLMGFEAEITEADIPEKGVMHRVRTGPYASAAEMNKARTTLAQNGIQTTLVKGR